MIRISNPLINSSQDGSQDAGAGRRGEVDSQDGQQDGMARDGSQDGPDRSPKSGGKSRMKLKSMRSVDKISDEGYVVPTPDRKVTEEQLRAAFEKIDIQGCGELDKEEIGLAAAEVGAVWNDKQLQHAFNMMDDDGNTNGFADFEEFASFWLGKGWEELRDEDSNATKPAASFVSTVTLLGSCGKIGQLLRKNAVNGVDKKKEKQVEPESVFVMSAEGSGLDGARAELMDKIQQIHENEFHQLEDLLNTHAESRVEAEVWERCANDSFSEMKVIQQLGWPQNSTKAAKAALNAAMQEETKGTINAIGGAGRAQAFQVCWRCFLKDALAHADNSVSGTKVQRQSSWDDQKGATAGSRDQLTEAARAFVKASHGELEAVLDDEVLPIDTAVMALVTALTEDLRSRDTRIERMVNRQSELADATPRKIMVSGLQGNSAIANGTYCADGLRACWGRPLYLQQVDRTTDREPYFLYYDQSYVKDDTTGIAQWSNGMWIIGPSQNSDRCTAYMPEVVHDGAVEKLLHPCCNVLARWFAYDVVKKQWLPGPGDHCPRLSVVKVGTDTYQDYIGKSIADQREMRELISRQVESNDFAARIQRKLSTYLQKENDIQRKSYMMVVRKLHVKELRKMQSAIIANILAAHDNKRLTLPGGNDFAENYALVETIVHKFVNSVESKQKQRVTQKRQFLAKMTRPAMTKAFFSWKMISRSSRANKDVASNMFAEPDTPWNVRHPRSKFTNIWEGCQAFLLVYVAFTVTYRLCFNIEVDGLAFFFDVLVDLYFVFDVIFNFHTAFYDASGDLAGVKDGPEGQHVADLQAMYWNYMKGWAFVDLLSVMPTIVSFALLSSTPGTGPSEESEMSPSQTKALKAIRLIRLTKLLRLVRAARLFKKYEEHFGPALSLLMVFGVIGLVLHTITCVWFVVGTMPGYSMGQTDRSVGWLQFVYSFEHCNCYDNATTFSQFFPDKMFDPRFAQADPPEDSRFRKEGMYFDPYDNLCHALDEEILDTAPKRMCDPSADIPYISDYYVKSLFIVVRNPQISDSYGLSAREMAFAITTTVILGSCWGILAGTFSTIFASNQLASQTYKMRIKQLKEFCRIKELPHGLCEKLEAHYYHLYPDKMMIDEEDVIAGFPSQLREELVGAMYGRQLYAVPLFLSLDIQILTELCTKLVPLPALKGAMIAREGVKGTHMYCISTGQIKISEKIKGGDEAGRLRHWIEDVYSHANRDIKLFKPSVNQQIEILVARIGRIAREKASNEDSPSLTSSTRPQHMALNMVRPSSDSDEDDDDELQQRLRAATESASLGVVTFKDLLYDDELVDYCSENGTNVRQLVTKAGVIGRIAYDGALSLTKADPVGPRINFVGGVMDVGAGTPAEQLCSALKDGEVLLDLIKMLVPRLAQSDRTKKSTVERNLQNFFKTLTDVDGHFKIPPELVFVPDDLLLYDQGPLVMQHERQRRVVSCVLEVGFVATHMDGYMGPRLDDQTLGMLGPTEFFGELSLLPIEGGWSHRRTAMVVQNSMLHTLSSVDVQAVSDRFPELRFRLVDHAEDYQRVQAAAAAAADIENLSAIKAKRVTTGQAAVAERRKDPLGIIKAQLSQQDAKLEQQSAQLQSILDLLSNMNT